MPVKENVLTRTDDFIKWFSAENRETSAQL